MGAMAAATIGATVVRAFAKHLAPAAEGLGMEKVAIQARVPDPAVPGGLKEVVFSVSQPGRTGITVSVTPPSRKLFAPSGVTV